MAITEHDTAPATSSPAPFHSVLFDSARAARVLMATEPPECFGDLNLDRVVESITAGREAYDLKPYFYQTLRSPAAVEYRHEVFRDLEDDGVRGTVDAFARRLREMRQHLARATQARAVCRCGAHGCPKIGR